MKFHSILGERTPKTSCYTKRKGYVQYNSRFYDTNREVWKFIRVTLSNIKFIKSVSPLSYSFPELYSHQNDKGAANKKNTNEIYRAITRSPEREKNWMISVVLMWSIRLC